MTNTINKEQRAKDLAILFHYTYERLAPEFGYETREETRSFDSESKKGRLMIAVAHEISDFIEQYALEARIDEQGVVLHWLQAQKKVNAPNSGFGRMIREAIGVFEKRLASLMKGDK